MTNKHDSIGGCIACHVKKFFDMHEKSDPIAGLHESIIQEVERSLFAETLKYTNNVQAKASNILGINRNTLRKKIVELGI
jgi:two-component system nitrogen regulation response regulator GlnG